MVAMTDENVTLPAKTFPYRAEDFLSAETGFYDVPGELDEQARAYGFLLVTSAEYPENGEKVNILQVYPLNSYAEVVEPDVTLHEGDKIAFLGEDKVVKL